MSTVIYFATLGLIIGTIVTVFAMRYVAIAKQAQARLDQTEAYRLLAERSAAAEAAAASALAVIQDTLIDVKARLGAVETILKDVG